MSSFCLNNGFRLQKTNRATRRWKQAPKKPFHHVSRDKILHDSWSISAALARGFSDRHFERGEGPGDEVGSRQNDVEGAIERTLDFLKPKDRNVLFKAEQRQAVSSCELAVLPTGFGKSMIFTVF